ncbi:gonadotropin-releasing hormone receptor [Lucilia cuprina]|uniref:gonadotropin-releasing hormone receptor n=1 Tax=Lucilia cuprina TaxID=7375 RepID=UPI001F061180|nr:gonadotropin-releasing hormone receptor [Lucilia cuprina]
MTINIHTEVARVPRMGDIVNVAGGFVNNLTKATLQITNDTMSLLYNDISSNATNNSALIASMQHESMLRNVFTRTTTSTTQSPSSQTVMPTLGKSTLNAASILSTTALQWLQQHPNSQLPATMKISDSSLAFLSNLTYTDSNIFIPATAGPAIEDDEIRLEHAPQLSKSAMIKVYVLSIMALFSLLGNVLTMWNIYKTRLARRNSRHSWSAIYSLIFHLSIADVLVTGFCIIGEAAWCYTVQWLANDLTCKLVKLFQMFSLYLSTYVLVLIGVDRWIAVKYPMKSLNMAKRCYRLLGGTYILSLLLSLPQFFIFRVARGPFIEEFYQCVTHGFYTAEWQEQLYATFTLVFTFLLPLCILFGTYMSTFRTISNSEKMFQGSKLAGYTNKPTSQTNRQRLIHKAKMKSLRISVVIIFAFLICWTPYNVMMLIFMFWNPDKRFGEDLQSAIFFFGMSNSLVNPLIYGAFHLCPMKRKTSKKSNNNNGTYSLNRGDSQRTPSMLTAVTQVDGNGRQVRTFRQSSYYRSISTGSAYKENIGLLQTTGPSSSATAINVPVTTPLLVRKSASMKSPHPNQRALVTSCPGNGGPGGSSSHKHNYNHRKAIAAAATQQYHNHSTEIIQNDNSVSSCSSVGRSDDSSDGACLSNGQIRGNGSGVGGVGAVSVVLSYDNQRGGVASMKNFSSSPLSGGENRNCLLTQTSVNAMGIQPLLSGMDDNVSSV